MVRCLHRVAIVEPSEGVCLQGTERDSGRGVLEMEHLSFLGALLGEPRGVIEGSGDGHLFPRGHHWEMSERALLGNLELDHLPGTLRDG